MVQEIPGVIGSVEFPSNQQDGIFLQGDAEIDEIGRLLRSRNPQDRDVVLEIENRQKVTNEKYQTNVRFEIQSATRELRENPDLAIERLKSILQTVRLAPDLYDEVRSELTARLESSLQSARREKFNYDERIARKLSLIHI